MMEIYAPGASDAIYGTTDIITQRREPRLGEVNPPKPI
jgi:hypothetical protein